MRSFTCPNCGQLVFFENVSCLRCGEELGFSPERREIVAVGAGDAARRCANQTLAGCNWLVVDGEAGQLCRSCRLTRTRPHDADLAGGPTALAFVAAEAAKRRLVFQLLELGLPTGSDLVFDLLSSVVEPVTTGHLDGVITIDLAESDDVHRARMRQELGEPYRTLLGHLRHEVAHYYWPVLVADEPTTERFRQLFGDERADYGEALERHYADGPPAAWGDGFVSAYATAHPWEDWAETFAHYLHIADTLQTAASFGLLVVGPDGRDPTLMAAPAVNAGERFEDILGDWLPLSYALNAVNRSMGKDDLYPFVLGPVVTEKLAFVHDLVVGSALRGGKRD